MSLLELMLVIAIGVLIGGGTFANTGLERATAVAQHSAANLNLIGQKTAELCDSTEGQCTGLTTGTVTLPTDYMPSMPTDPDATSPTAAAYQIALNTNAADGTKCFTIEGVNSYPHDALLDVPNQNGAYNTESATGAPGFLHYDSRQGLVYQTTGNTSPVAAGC